MTKIIGITGGIGSGKTTVANFIASKGFPVYIADLEARRISETPEISAKIAGDFGKEILLNDVPDRKLLAQLVFNNPEKLKKLNDIIHPEVRRHFKEWLLLHQNQPLVFKESAILFESGSDRDCDAVITVSAPLELRIARTHTRDATTRAEILKRIANQWTDEQREAKSDYRITNLEIEDTYLQIDEILKKLHNL